MESLKLMWMKFFPEMLEMKVKGCVPKIAADENCDGIVLLLVSSMESLLVKCYCRENFSCILHRMLVLLKVSLSLDLDLKP